MSRIPIPDGARLPASSRIPTSGSFGEAHQIFFRPHVAKCPLGEKPLELAKTKFYQMIGRGIRLAAELFGPQQDKTTFYIFDYCQNFEYFNANPQGITASPSKSLSQRLFNLRLRLLANISNQTSPLSATNLEQRANIPMIHKQLELIEAVQEPSWWRGITLDMLEELRIKFRSIVHFIDKQSRPILYTNFSDQFGGETSATYDIINRDQQDEPLAHRAASAQHALAPLLDSPLTTKQRAYLRTIIDYLTQNNTLDLGLLYQPPFTNYHDEGPDGLFHEKEVDQLFEILENFNEERQGGT